MKLSLAARWVSLIAVALIYASGLEIKSAAARTVEAAPLDTYGRLPSLENVAISPTGTVIAFVRTVINDRWLAIVNLADRKLLKAARLGNLKLRSIEWADDEHLLLFSSTTGVPIGLIGSRQEWYTLTVYNFSSGKLSHYPVPDNTYGTLNALSGDVMIRRVNGETLLFVPAFNAPGARLVPVLFKVSLSNGRQSLVAQGDRATRRWLVDEAGDVVAEDSYADDQQLWRIRLHRGRSWITAESTKAPIDVPEMLGFGPQADTILLMAPGKESSVWELLSLQDGKIGPPMEESRSLRWPLVHPATHRMIGGVRVNDERTYILFDKDLQSRWNTVVNTYPYERIEWISSSADLSKLVLLIDGANGYRYEMFDVPSQRTVLLGDVYDGIKSSYETRAITYAAGDGLQIHAYVTLPAKRPPEKLPLIVLPHGGPQVRDTAEFDWWAQALASKGYAVLKPNYRGSSGTDAWVKAGYGEWGKKMQTDLSDGVRYLAKAGMIDPNRVCIVGASYGGYAALAGVTLDPDVYRCAISVAGLSDLKRMLQYEDRTKLKIVTRYWDRFMGVTGYTDPALETFSPIKHLDRIRVPVLLIHGQDDTVVPFEQSDLMLSAMKKAHLSVELVKMKNEDHWLSRSETRLQMLQATAAFLMTNNPP